MKTFPALYIDPSGVIRYISEYPEEPKKWVRGDSLSYNEAAWQHYKDALAAAKESAIECADQGQIKKLLFEKFCIFPVEYTNKEEYIRSLPKGWSVELGQEETRSGDGYVNGFKVVAVLIPTDTDAGKESQEELWKGVENYIKWPYQEFDIDEVMKQFTISRK